MGKLPPLAITLIKAIIHLSALSTLAYLYLLIDSGQLGADPVKEVIHFLGKTGLNFLLLCLAITPLSKRLKQPGLMRLRRLLGLYSFAWITLHIIAFAWLELNWQLMFLLEEVVKRPYLAVGMVAWVILLLLSITSINALKRKMKQAWVTLHRWVYVALLLGVVHYYWSVKSGLIEATIYIIVALLLLSERRSFFKALFTKLFHRKAKKV